MTNLKHGTLIECLGCSDRDLSRMAANALGTEEPLSIEGREIQSLSVGAIMDLYWNGDAWMKKKAKELMIEMISDYIHKLAHMYFPTYSGHYHEDLYMNGVVGALRAMETYDGVYAFTTYSKVYILHEMSVFVGQLNGNPSPYYSRIQKQVKEAVLLFESEGLPIDSGEISRATGINPLVVKRELMLLGRPPMLYLSSLNDDYDILEDKSGDMMEASILNMDMSRALRTLNEEEQEIVSMVFSYGLSIGKLSKRLSISYYDAKKRYDRAMRKLRAALSGYGG